MEGRKNICIFLVKKSVDKRTLVETNKTKTKWKNVKYDESNSD